MHTQNKITAAGHTAGPWHVIPMQLSIWTNDGETKVATVEDLPWVTLSSGLRTSDSATECANARLIAAAPELLEALEAMVAPYEGTSDADVWWLRQARAAIARAKGQ